MSGVFGGLMSTPIGGPLLAFELEHEQTHGYYDRHLVPGMLAGAVTFGLMWPVIGAPFSGLLDIPRPDFESWMLLAAAGMEYSQRSRPSSLGRRWFGSATPCDHWILPRSCADSSLARWWQ